MGLCWRTCGVWPILGSGHSLHRQGTQGALCPPGEEWPVGSGRRCRSAALWERPLFLAGVRRASPISSSLGCQSRAWTKGQVPAPRANPCPSSQPAARAEWLWGRGPSLLQPPPGAARCFPGAGPWGLALLGNSSTCRVSEETRPQGAGRTSHSCPLGGRAVSPAGQAVGLWPWPHGA